MTYSNRSIECSGYRSGWQSFWLRFHRQSLETFRGKWQPLESPFHRFRSGMDVPLQNRDAAVTSDPHDREGVHSRFSESSKHCMAQ